MLIESLQLSHQKLLSEKFQKLQLDISEYSFANCYLFRKTHGYQVISVEEELFLQGKTYDGKLYLMPTKDIRLLPRPLLKMLQETVDFFFPIPEEWVHGFSVTSFDQDSDYVFSTAKIAEYSGRHLAGRRNLVHQFEKQYEAHAEPLANEAIHVLDLWKNQGDYEACKEAIELHQELGLVGRLYTVDTKPVGFIIGEPLNNSMFVLHFAKADITYKGIYQYMYQAFAKELVGKFQFLNWEQDLNDEGLRRSKEAYLPDRHVKKLRLRIA
jgi:uncharacterized protein